MEKRHRHLREKRHRTHLALAFLGDVFLAAGILLVYAFFSFGLPALRRPAAAPAATPVPAQAEQAAPAAVEPEATPDTRTPWQIRFQEHFTDTVVRTENSYSSPNVAITVESFTWGEGAQQSVYHVADIYIASPENLCTYTANNELKYFSVQDAMEMDEASGALVAISGDQYSYQPSGFLIRNGEAYRTDYTYCDLCVLFNDGSMACYPPDGYDIDRLLERGVAQAWNFGPSLLDENGAVYDSYSVSTSVGYPNPRSAIGYYEPGHYCFVVADGRQEGYSQGLTVPELAQIFQDLGCACAYNLDGGGSALMTFQHRRWSRQSNGADRDLGDIILVRETEGTE